MARTVVVSNRGPKSFALDQDGHVKETSSSGGLASTLSPLFSGQDVVWIAAALSEADRIAAKTKNNLQSSLPMEIVSPDPDQYQMAYDVVANSTLWNCHHHLFDSVRRPRFDRFWHQAFDAYRYVNELFADAVVQNADEDSLVLVQDYHFSLLGEMIARRRADLKTVHFTHTPFADPAMFHMLPETVVREILFGMAGYTSCGFHCERWRRCFVSQYGFAQSSQISGPNHSFGAPMTFVSPLGIDASELLAQRQSDEVAEARRDIAQLISDRKLIVRVDRVEPSKNILRGFWAYDEFLEANPKWRTRVMFLAFVYPSRETLPDYLAYRCEIENLAQQINEKWGRDDWTPIIVDVADDRARSVAALTLYDVLLVNPIRDGLNLVAKEGPVLNTVWGVEILSKEAGAFDELATGVEAINPFDISNTAAAFSRALEMSTDERKCRGQVLADLAKARSSKDWLDDQVAAGSRQ